MGCNSSVEAAPEEDQTESFTTKDLPVDASSGDGREKSDLPKGLLKDLREDDEVVSPTSPGVVAGDPHDVNGSVPLLNDALGSSHSLSDRPASRGSRNSSGTTKSARSSDSAKTNSSRSLASARSKSTRLTDSPKSTHRSTRPTSPVDTTLLPWSVPTEPALDPRTQRTEQENVTNKEDDEDATKSRDDSAISRDATERNVSSEEEDKQRPSRQSPQLCISEESVNSEATKDNMESRKSERSDGPTGTSSSSHPNRSPKTPTNSFTVPQAEDGGPMTVKENAKQTTATGNRRDERATESVEQTATKEEEYEAEGRVYETKPDVIPDRTGEDGRNEAPTENIEEETAMEEGLQEKQNAKIRKSTPEETEPASATTTPGGNEDPEVTTG